MIGRSVVAAVACALCLIVGAAAQQPLRGPADWRFVPGYVRWEQRGDVQQVIATGGIRFYDPSGGFDVSADRAIAVLDHDEFVTAAEKTRQGSGLPRRMPPRPDNRRAINEELMRERLSSFLSAARREVVEAPLPQAEIEVFRSIYFEGNVSIVQDGLETMKADSLYFSLLEDRVVLRGVTLRLTARNEVGQPLQLSVRSKELIRQGKRFVGRSTSITGCPAGEPHWEVFSNEIEILERGDEFEIRSKGNSLAFFGASILPMPNQSWRSSEQSNMLLKGVSVGHSQREGFRARVEIGSSFNDVGGSIHEALTGGPAEEFTGDWRLGVGWIEKRGFPIDGQVEYQGGDKYFGRAMGFWLEDSGSNFRDIRTDINGDVIDNTNRWLGQTENRIFFGDTTTADLTLFGASDEAVYSEFFRGHYYTAERPESSLVVRDAKENLLLLGSMRWNMASFSYTSGRALDDYFREELPNLSMDLFNEPILDLPGNTAVFATSSTNVAQLGNDFDDKLDTPTESTWRANQSLQLSVPIHLDPVSIRAYVNGSYTYFSEDDPTTGEDLSGFDFWGGAEIGSQLSRTWRWFDDTGSAVAVRHTMSPTIRYDERWAMFDPSTIGVDLYEFGPVNERELGSNVRVGLLQRLQHSDRRGGQKDVTEFLWLDLAQNFKPNPDRDNNGDALGLFEFDFRMRPRPEWLSGGPGLQFVIEGQHDWNTGEMRTWNNYLQIMTGDVTWLGEYRTDVISGGVAGIGVKLPIRRRWELFGRTQYDVVQDRTVNYIARLTRRDLNWRLLFEVAYDAVTEDTSFRIGFAPNFGGLFDDRGGEYMQGVPFGANNYSSF